MANVFNGIAVDVKIFTGLSGDEEFKELLGFDVPIWKPVGSGRNVRFKSEAGG